jgi:hypothetical protein
MTPSDVTDARGTAPKTKVPPQAEFGLPNLGLLRYYGLRGWLFPASAFPI